MLRGKRHVDGTEFTGAELPLHGKFRKNGDAQPVEDALSDGGDASHDQMVFQQNVPCRQSAAEGLLVQAVAAVTEEAQIFLLVGRGKITGLGIQGGTAHQDQRKICQLIGNDGGISYPNIIMDAKVRFTVHDQGFHVAAIRGAQGQLHRRRGCLKFPDNGRQLVGQQTFRRGDL